MEAPIIVTTASQLEEIIERIIRRIENEREKGKPEKIYSVNQAAKHLHLSHSTVKNRILEGMIKTTKDGRISESSINEFLKNIPP